MCMLSPRLRALGAGGKAALPLALGLVPFMLIYGVVMHAAGYTPLVAQAMTLLVFAGSQVVAAQQPRFRPKARGFHFQRAADESRGTPLALMDAGRVTG